MTENELKVIYTAIDNMTGVQKKILDTQQKMVEQFKKVDQSSRQAGDRIDSSMKKGEKSLSSVEGQIARLNQALKIFGVQLDTIDIYMLSAFKAKALYELVQLFKEAVNEAEKFKNTLRGLTALSEYFGQSSTAYFKELQKLSLDGRLSIQQLAESMRNLINSGFTPEQAGKTLEALKITGTVLGTQAGMPLQEAVERTTQGLLKLRLTLLDTTNVIFTVENAIESYRKRHGILNRELTETEKRLAAAEVLWTAALPLQDAYDKSLNELTGSIGRLNTAWSNFKLTLGTGWSPLMDAIITSLHGLLVSVKEIIRSIEADVLRLFFGINAVGQSIINIFTGNWSKIKSDWQQGMRDIQTMVSETDLRWDNPSLYLKIKTPQIPSPLKAEPETSAVKENKIEEYRQALIRLSTDPANKAVLNVMKAVRDGLVALDEANIQDIEDYNYKRETLMRNAGLKLLSIGASFNQQESETQIRHSLNLLEIQNDNLEISKKEYYEKKLELTRKLLEQEREYLNHLEKMGDVDAWRSQVREVDQLATSLAEVNLELFKVSGTFQEGLNRGFKEYVNEAQTSFQAGELMAQRTASAMENTFSTIFFDAMKGEFKSLSDYILSFTNMIMKAIAEIYAKMIVLKVLGSTMGMFGGVGMPSNFWGGGYTNTQFASGYDDFIWRPGKGAIRINPQDTLIGVKDEESLGGRNSPSINITMENKTGLPLDLKSLPSLPDQKNQVKNIILELIFTDPSFKNSFSGSR